MQREVRWWWVRHAPVINPSGNIYGQLDRKADLSNGAAFAALAQRLPRGAEWCVTPLSRTQDTAARLIADAPAGPTPGDIVADKHLGAVLSVIRAQQIEREQERLEKARSAVDAAGASAAPGGDA